MYLPVGDCHGIFALCGFDMKCIHLLSCFSLTTNELDTGLERVISILGFSAIFRCMTRWICLKAAKAPLWVAPTNGVTGWQSANRGKGRRHFRFLPTIMIFRSNVEHYL